MPNNTITIPIDDWVDEYLKEEPNVSTEDAMIETLVDREYSTQQVGRMCVVAQQRGEAPFFPIPKLLVQTGASRAISDMVSRRKKDVNIRGHRHTVREFVGSVQEPVDPEDPDSAVPVKECGYSRFLSKKALEDAAKYLRAIAPGHIQSRLNIIALNGGNVREAAETLKQRIDEMVNSLV